MELAGKTGDGPHLWSGLSKGEEGRHLEKDRAGGTAEMSRQRGRRDISATRFQWRGGHGLRRVAAPKQATTACP